MAVDFDSGLVNAIEFLTTFNLGMGDSMSDVVEWFCWEAYHDYNHYAEDEYGNPPPDDYMIEDSLTKLVKERNKFIPETLNYLFTEEDLIDDIIEVLEGNSYMARRDTMLEALETVYFTIDKFPKGQIAKNNLKLNILFPMDIEF